MSDPVTPFVKEAASLSATLVITIAATIAVCHVADRWAEVHRPQPPAPIHVPPPILLFNPHAEAVPPEMEVPAQEPPIPLRDA